MVGQKREASLVPETSEYGVSPPGLSLKPDLTRGNVNIILRRMRMSGKARTERWCAQSVVNASLLEIPCYQGKYWEKWRESLLWVAHLRLKYVVFSVL